MSWTWLLFDVLCFPVRLNQQNPGCKTGQADTATLPVSLLTAGRIQRTSDVDRPIMVFMGLLPVKPCNRPSRLLLNWLDSPPLPRTAVPLILMRRQPLLPLSRLDAASFWSATGSPRRAAARQSERATRYGVRGSSRHAWGVLGGRTSYGWPHRLAHWAQGGWVHDWHCANQLDLPLLAEQNSQKHRFRLLEAWTEADSSSCSGTKEVQAHGWGIVCIASYSVLGPASSSGREREPVLSWKSSRPNV
jgi:hypothetical protein